MGTTHPGADGSSKVQQHHAKDSDMRTIVDRQRRTGVYGTTRAAMRPRQPIWGDFQNVDLHQSMMLVQRAREGFMQLKPALRRKFMDSPAMLVEWVNNPENRFEAIKLGLITPTPEEVEVIEQAAFEAAKKAAEKDQQTNLVKEAEKASEKPTDKGGNKAV